jgi:hypothetical protein
MPCEQGHVQLEKVLVLKCTYVTDDRPVVVAIDRTKPPSLVQGRTMAVCCGVDGRAFRQEGVGMGAACIVL